VSSVCHFRYGGCEKCAQIVHSVDNLHVLYKERTLSLTGRDDIHHAVGLSTTVQLEQLISCM
jgi:hypothetical protein